MYLGNTEAALAGYNEALSSTNRLPRWYFMRGLAHMLAGSNSEASADFDKALAQDAPDHYAALLGWYVHQMGGRKTAANQTLMGTLGSTDDEWTGRIAAFLLGRTHADAFLTRAINQEQRCEAFFYVGLWHRAHARIPESRASLEQCIAPEVTPFVEYRIASALLTKSASNASRN